MNPGLPGSRKRYIVSVAASLVCMSILGCGSGGAGSHSGALTSISQAPPTASTPTTATTATAVTSYKFVDDSFAAQTAPAKKAWDDTGTVVVEAKNFGDGSLTGATLQAAISAL